MLGGADNPNGELPSYITGANNVNRRALCSAFSYYPPTRRLHYFVGCFAGVMMYGPFDGKAKPAERVLSTWLTNGCWEYAVSPG